LVDRPPLPAALPTNGWRQAPFGHRSPAAARVGAPSPPPLGHRPPGPRRGVRRQTPSVIDPLSAALAARVVGKPLRSIIEGGEGWAKTILSSTPRSPRGVVGGETIYLIIDRRRGAESRPPTEKRFLMSVFVRASASRPEAHPLLPLPPLPCSAQTQNTRVSKRCPKDGRQKPKSGHLARTAAVRPLPTSLRLRLCSSSMICTRCPIVQLFRREKDKDKNCFSWEKMLVRKSWTLGH
jgi:hypothetical protein